ncbi:MAG TPA: serine hydrolase domain-containing protein [Actinophytocola sp.]|uniref:serine hydrolase domain-containing protein n=1 Tax=Actinophytocola sp. TaxID=1872138 RepID=UPI002DBAB322|nr:serine hydrolase domain-containing protein [Actinophytocola sp.]HEU5473541.1 serine hydrolase domain-containing protein [Actinophytocola sp.]
MSRFLTEDWLRRAGAAFARLPVDDGSAVRIGLAVTDAPDGVLDGLVLAVDMATGGIRFDRDSAPESGNPTLWLTHDAAAALLLGSPAERVGVFETGANRASGNFTEMFFLDQVLQQDSGGVLAELRAQTSDLPAGFGRDGWASPADAAPKDSGESAAVAAATEALPRTMARLREELGRSTPGAQLYVSLHGRQVADVGLGTARPGVPFSRHSPTLWYCCAKPLGSVAVGRLWERGLLDPFDPVSAYLPDFTGDGRERLTLAQIMTHTGPVPTGRDPLHGCLFGPDDLRHKLVRELAMPPAEPGRVNYTQWWAWLLLAEVIEAVDGRDYDRYVTEEILTPCGIADSTRVRLSTADFARVGTTLPVLYINANAGPAAPTYWFSSAAATTCALPGVNTRGPMSDLGRFMEMLLAGGRAPGGRILAPPTVSALTARHRNGIRDRFGNADWGLGFKLECRHLDPELTAFSRHASPRSFGHEGLWTAVSFADPDAGLVVALHLNGKTRHERHGARMARICDAVYEDLGT